jgi:hypothetical protein
MRVATQSCPVDAPSHTGHIAKPLQLHKVTAMDTKSMLRALGVALTMVAAAAGTGWALQLPLTATVFVSPVEIPRLTTPAEAPAPNL